MIVLNGKIIERLSEAAGAENVCLNESMSAHTTFRAGGAADAVIKICDSEVLKNTVRILQQEDIPFVVIGNGSNLLVSDKGYRGVIIVMTASEDDIRTDGERMYVSAGDMLVSVSNAAQKADLSGLSFAAGIPGTVGGGLVMNAGAYGGELKQVVESVIVFDTQSGRELTLTNEEMQFGYRTSVLKSKPYIALSAVLKLNKGDGAAIKAEMDDYNCRRRDKQPLNYPSAGSTFKRPEGYFAGKLIEDAGLRGYRVGDAMVSDKHCGFVVNVGEATAEDILSVIRDVRHIVYEKFGVTLEPEVCMLGEDMTI